jgi:uncharacterized protein YfiM (DUF2279 family)
LLRIIAISLCFSIGNQVLASSDTVTTSNKRKSFVIAGNAVAYTASMIGLYNLWYKDYPLSKFHFQNDNADWNQMDKVGHVYSCYYEGVVGIDQMKWAGFPRKKAIILGGSYGFLIQTSVEVFDGFSEEWGASTGDLVANLTGAGLVIGQALNWDEQRIWMKLSFQETSYPSIRPELLGTSYLEHLFKDYNGQTYWLSGNIRSFLKEDSKFPAWLNIAVGYGVDGLVGADDNLFERDGQMFDYSSIYRKRQWYISPDIDLTRIPTKNKALKIAFRLLNSLKFPLPGLQYDGRTHDISFNFIQF